MRPVVIIDGNNLAHRKYQLSNRNVPIPMMNRLIYELSIWAEREQCFVELCFDPCALDPQKTEYLRVFVARTRTKADDVVEERALYHAYRRETCVVVTEDGDLQNKVTEACAQYFRCDEFANGYGPYGFMLLPSIPDPPPLVPEDDGGKARDIGQKKSHKKTKKVHDHSRELQELHQKTLANRLRSSSFSITSVPEIAIEPVTEIDPKPETIISLAASLVPEDKYTLNICNWPVQKGIRYIIESACPAHKKEIQAVVGDITGATPKDLLSLFTLLVNLCRDEPDFISRGGSLMDRVRLALIKRHPDPLTFIQITELVGGNTSGMQRKIDKYIPVWLEKGSSDEYHSKSMEV